MEQHKNKLLINEDNIPTLDLNYVEYFRRAHKLAYDNYKDTIDRIQNTTFSNLTLETFWREYVWCVYTSDFNAKIVSRFFDKLMEVYRPILNYAINSKSGAIYVHHIRDKAREYCDNNRKITAIFNMADILNIAGGEDGWIKYRDDNLNTPDKLQALPFIGPITKYHLARNIGILDVVKPDLHLVRAAKNWGLNSPLELCKKIQEEYDLPLGIIDLILWYSMSHFGSK